MIPPPVLGQPQVVQSPLFGGLQVSESIILPNRDALITSHPSSPTQEERMGKVLPGLLCHTVSV